jgi:hypothetical protein
MTTKDITMTSLSFAQTAALPALKQSVHGIPTGSWTLYFHEPEDKTWTPDSYKFIHSISSWESLGAVLREMGPSRILNGMMFCMLGDISPLWENKSNIRGGSYCLKVARRSAVEIYNLYLAAAACGIAATDASNSIVGVTMSPKKGFCIIKLWNANAKAFNKSSDIIMLHNDVKAEEILYRPHTEQKM